MMSYLSHNSDIVASLQVASVNGWPNGLGIHRLRFSVNYTTISRKEVFVARNFRAIVGVSRTLGQSTLHLGIAWPESAWSLRTGQFTNQAGILFDLDLHPEQLTQIERFRNGGALAFHLSFQCEIESPGRELQGARLDVGYALDKSGWMKCLREFGLDRLILLEVDIPSGATDLQSAVDLLKKAREELDAGNYDGVVQQCRRAIESVEKALKLEAEINSAIKAFCGTGRKQMTKRARGLVINEACLHFAHLAHHVDEEGRTFDYGRRDAAFMLALASAVVANASRM